VVLEPLEVEDDSVANGNGRQGKDDNLVHDKLSIVSERKYCQKLGKEGRGSEQREGDKRENQEGREQRSSQEQSARFQAHAVSHQKQNVLVDQVRSPDHQGRHQMQKSCYLIDEVARQHR
jgi:hypothetical protein